MRTDIVEIKFEDMSPALRSMITYEPNGAMNMETPQELFDEVLRTSPVVRWEMGVGFFRMEDIVAVARNRHIVSCEPNSGEAMGMGSAEPLVPLHIDGDLHKHYRKLLDPLFTPPKMKLLEPTIRATADQFIDAFIGDGQAEMYSAFCTPLPSTVFMQIFGLPLEDLDFLIEKKNRILKNEGTTMEESERIGRAEGLEMRAHLRKRLQERLSEGVRHDDLIDTFIHFEVDGHRLNEDEIINIMHLFTIAGLDTVTSSLSCILAWFAKHPEERRRMIEHPELLPAAVEELMRYESPVPSGGVRFVTDDCEINGVPLRKGELVYLCWASANVDPEAFESPREVDLAREPNRHIAFASGLHRCLGSHLARIEIVAAIDQLHRRVSDYWVTPGEAVEYEFAGVRAANHLPLTFAVR
jgi:cytochrome P450